MTESEWEAKLVKLREQILETPEFIRHFEPDRWLEVEHIYTNLMQRLGVRTK